MRRACEIVSLWEKQVHFHNDSPCFSSESDVSLSDDGYHSLGCPSTKCLYSSMWTLELMYLELKVMEFHVNSFYLWNWLCACDVFVWPIDLHTAIACC